MKKQLLNLSIAFAAMVFIAGNAFAQLTPPIATLEVPAIDDGVMTLDGYADESAYSSKVDVAVIFNKPSGFGDDPDMSGTFQICWNNVGIYVFFDIKDDIAHNWNGTDGPSHMFDNVELFFNFDTSGIDTSGRYQPDGIQMRFNRGYDGEIDISFGNSEPWKDTTTTDTTYDFRTVPCEYKQNDNSGQWTVEALVPWLYILPSGTKPEDILDSIAAHKNAFGFDVSLADSDDPNATEGARDCQSAWDSDGGTGSEDNAWQDVRTFGILKLTGTPITSTHAPSTSKFGMYPNPANNVVNFRDLNGVYEITVVNALGQTVKVVDVTTDNVVLPVSDLAKGTYVAIVKSENETYTSKFVKR